MIQKVRDTLQTDKKGFTLIELLVVVAIIAILAAIAIPQYSKYRMRGRDAAAVSDLKHIQLAAEAAYADNMTYGSEGTPSSWQLSQVTVDGQSIKLSNRTEAKYGSDNDTYAAATYNTGGTKGYGTGNNMSNINYLECGKKPCGSGTAPDLGLEVDNGTVGNGSPL